MRTKIDLDENVLIPYDDCIVDKVEQKEWLYHFLHEKAGADLLYNQSAYLKSKVIGDCSDEKKALSVLAHRLKCFYQICCLDSDSEHAMTENTFRQAVVILYHQNEKITLEKLDETAAKLAFGLYDDLLEKYL